MEAKLNINIDYCNAEGLFFVLGRPGVPSWTVPQHRAALRRRRDSDKVDNRVTVQTRPGSDLPQLASMLAIYQSSIVYRQEDPARAGSG